MGVMLMIFIVKFVFMLVIVVTLPNTLLVVLMVKLLFGTLILLNLLPIYLVSRFK